MKILDGLKKLFEKTAGPHRGPGRFDPDCPEVLRFWSPFKDDPASRPTAGRSIEVVIDEFESKHELECARCRTYRVVGVGR